MDLMEQQSSRNASQLLSFGNHLAEGKWSEWVGNIEDQHVRAATAVLLENEQQHLYDTYPNQLNEDTLMSKPGIATLEQMAFPLVRAVFPNLVATELVSVQPMTGPSSLIFYLQFLYGTSKGQTVAGTTMFDYPDKNYSSELIDNEGIGSGNGGSATVAVTPLSFTKVRPGSVEITDGTKVIRDDGQGNLVGDITGSVTLNYATGEFSAANITFSGGGYLVPGAVTATYEFDSEGSTDIPQIDLVLTSTPVVARPRKLRARYSLEAAANLRRVHGLDAETELSAVMAEELKFEIDREIIDQLFGVAGAGTVSFSKTPPAGVSYNEHKQAFIDTSIEAGNLIFQKTRRAQANWMVLGTQAANIVESLPGFVPSGVSGTMGVLRIGMLNGRWTCYKDPYVNENSFLVGYKGMSWLETGYVYAPYIPLFMTQSVTLDDFISRKGLGTSYAKKVVNNKFYVKGTIAA